MKIIRQLPIVDGLLFFSIILLLVLHYTKGYGITNIAYFFLAYIIFNLVNKFRVWQKEKVFYEFIKRFNLKHSWDYFLRNYEHYKNSEL